MSSFARKVTGLNWNKAIPAMVLWLWMSEIGTAQSVMKYAHLINTTADIQTALYDDYESQNASNSSDSEPNTFRIPMKLHWQHKMKLALIPLFTILGLIGNTLSFLVMSTKPYRKKSYSYYLKGLAIFDSLTLLTYMAIELNPIVYRLTGVSYLSHHADWTCKLSEFLRHVVILMSSWLVVLFTVDRYIAVCHPLRRPCLCTVRRAVITIVAVTVIVCLSQVFRLTFIQRVQRASPWSYPCHAPVESRLHYYAWHYFWFSLTLRFFLPFVVICICNALIIGHIELRMAPSRYTERWEHVHKVNMAIYTLYLVCAVFIICLLPNAITALLQYSVQTVSFRRYLMWFDSPFQMIRLLNYSINFLLYGLTGKQFRHQAMRVCCPKQK